MPASARGVRDALAALLALACTRGPLLMVVEDVHWLDPPSLDLLAHLAAHCRCLPALLVLTTRPDNARLGPGWRAASQGCPLTTIDLGPLSAAEAHAMARHYGAADEAFVAGCVARADGNPLFLDQLLRAGEARHGVPGSVQSLVLARLDRLPAGDRQVLQAASVLGQRFSAEALAPLAGASDEALERLVCEALIRPEDGEYLFVHALIREAVYASLLRSRRHHLHQRAAEWFAAGDLAARAGHLEAAGDGTAGAAWLAAAREEASRFHYERALRHAERGIALAAGDRVTRYALRCLRAESLRELGLTEDSVFAYHEALHDADAVGERARAWLGVAAGLRILDRAREALSALDEAERAAAQAGDDLALAEACWLRGNVVFPLGDMAGCLQAHGKARELARAAGSPVLEARALSGLGDAHYSSGRYLSAHELFAACIALARTHRLARVEAANLPMLAVTHWFRLEFAPAWECARTALRLTQATGDMRGEIITRISLGAFHQFDAHFEQAASEAEAGLRISRQLGARRFELESAGRLASALGGMGETARAEALLTEVIAQSRERDARYIGPSLLGWFVAVTCDADKRDAALAEGEALLAQGCVSHCYLDFLSGAADAMLAAGEWTRATRYIDMLADYNAPEPLPWNDWFIRRSRALVALGLAPADRSAREAAVALLDQGRRLGLAPLLAPLEAACAPASGTASINPGVNAP